METLERFLRQHPFCRDMDEKHLQLMVGCASNMRIDAGQYIFREGGPADQFFLIRSGKVAVEFYAPQCGTITLLTLSDGDPLGWSWVCPPYTWSFDARAIELTRAILLDGKCIRGKFEQDFKLGYEIMRRSVNIIEKRLEAARLQLLNVYSAESTVGADRTTPW